MKFRPLGRTGLKVSEVGFGAWAIGGNQHGNSYGHTDDRDSLKAIWRALELGCNFFDTADVYGYGHSEELLGKALAGHRDQVILATKVGGDFYSGFTRMNFSSDYIRFAVEESLKRLQTEMIDLYQLHNPSYDTIEEGTIFEVLESLKQEGKIRFYGVSIFEPQEGIAAMETGRSNAIQLVFNLLNWKPGKELFPLAKEKGVGIIAREPLHNGFLTGKYSKGVTFPKGDIRAPWPSDYIATRLTAAETIRYLANEKRTLAQAALKFVLGSDAVSVVIPGCKTEAQVQENMGASDCEDLTQAEVDRMIRTFL